MGLVSLRLAQALREDEASNAALLRAFERASGAIEYTAPDYVKPRADEARRNARRSATALYAAADQAGLLSEQIRASPQLERVRVSDVAAFRREPKLSEAAAEFLIAFGAPKNEVTKEMAQAEATTEDIALAFAEGAPVLVQLAVALEEWEPERDLIRRPA